jgi:hypothetical protein
LNRHSWKKNKLLLVFFTAVFITGCGKEPDKKDYIARVNDSYLTQSDVDKMTDTSYYNNFYRSEIIRNWIDEELLYQQAVDEGVVNEEEFNRIMFHSRKTLAGALLLEQVSDQYEFIYSDDDLEKFYEDNKDDFKLSGNAYLLNIAEFTNEDEAIGFRTSILQNSWKNVVESAKYEYLFKTQNNTLLNEDEIYPLLIRNVVSELYPDEISIVINADTSRYLIIQVVDKYSGGTILPFNLIKEKVEKRFILKEKRKFINEYIKRLYANNDIEVKNRDN